MDINQFVKSAWRCRWGVVAIFVVANVIAAITMLKAPRLYRAESVLMFDDARSLAARGAGDTGESATQEARRLKSESLLAKSDTVVARALSSAKNGAAISDLDIRKAQNSIKVSADVDTDLLVVSFKDFDPVMAARVANNVAEAIIDVGTKFRSNPTAAAFFNARMTEYEAQLKRDTNELKNFAVSHGIYAIEEQKRLMLQRSDKVQGDLATTQASIKNISAKLASFRLQLSSLKAKMNLPVEIFGQSDFATRRAKGDAGLDTDPPLLHVRLYQDSSQKLVDANAELAGGRALELSQKEQLSNVAGQLAVFARLTAENDELETKVARDKTNILLFTQKQSEAEISNAWKSNEDFSNMQFFERARPPDTPVFPVLSLVLAVSNLAGFILSIMLILCVYLARRYRESAEPFGLPGHSDDAVQIAGAIRT